MAPGWGATKYGGGGGDGFSWQAHKRTCVLVHLSTRHTTHAYHVRFHTLYVSVQKASFRPAAAAVVAEYAGFSRGVKFYSQRHT